MSHCKHLDFFQSTGNCLDCGVHYVDIIDTLRKRVEELEVNRDHWRKVAVNWGKTNTILNDEVAILHKVFKSIENDEQYTGDSYVNQVARMKRKATTALREET